MRCRPSLVRGRAAQVNPGGFTTPARRPSVPHRTAGCGKSSLRPLMADTTLPASRRKAAARRVEGFLRAAAGTRSDFDLLRDLQGIVDLDTEVPDCRFQPMPEKSSHDSPEQSPSKSHQGGCDVVTLLRTTPFAALPHRTSGIRLFCQELSEPKRTPQSR